MISPPAEGAKPIMLSPIAESPLEPEPVPASDALKSKSSITLKSIPKSEHEPELQRAPESEPTPESAPLVEEVSSGVLCVDVVYTDGVVGAEVAAVADVTPVQEAVVEQAPVSAEATLCVDPVNLDVVESEPKPAAEPVAEVCFTLFFFFFFFFFCFFFFFLFFVYI